MVDSQALKKKLGVVDWSAIDADKALEAFRDHQKITLEELRYLNEVVPGFLTLARDGLTAMQTVAKGAEATQRLALENHGKVIDGLRDLGAAMQSDAARLAMAEKLEKAAKTNRKMNKDNNSIWGKMVVGVVAIAAISGAVLTGRGNLKA